jgi:hypothetical protein
LGSICNYRKRGEPKARGASSLAWQNRVQEEHYTLAIEARDIYLYVRSSGVRTRATVTAMTMEIFDAALGKGVSKVLFDVRELEGRLGALDSYFVVTDVFQ